MIKIIIKNNLTYILNLTKEYYQDIYNLLSYEVPGFKYSKLPEYARYVRLLKKVKNKEEYYFPTGLIYLIENYFNKKNIKIEKVEERIKPKSKDYFSFTNKFKNPPLRYYQKEIINKCLSEERGVIEATTGSGKTLTMVNLIKELSLPTLIVTPSKSILNQFYKILLDAFGSKIVGIVSSDKKEFKKKIVIANYQSLASKKIPDNFFRQFDVLCIDEFHHSAAETISTLNKEKFQDIYYRFGFTATFTRGSSDLMELYGVLKDVIYEYPAVKAIEDGFLFKPTFTIINYYHKFDSSSVSYLPPGKAFKAEYKKCITDSAEYNDRVIKIARYILGKNIPTIVFVDEIEHGNYLSERIEGSVFVNGQETSANTQKNIDLFNKGQIRCIVGTSVIGEGVDTVAAACGIIASGGKSQIETMQRVGRVLRLHPEKKVALIVDFLHHNLKYGIRHSKVRESIYKKHYNANIIYDPPNLI